MPTFEIEERYYEKYSAIAGLDEAGRGPLAGPVVAAAVVLSRGLIIEGVNDSKKLTEKKREILCEVIKEKSTAWAVGVVNAEEIDEYNIRNAAFLAMSRALDGVNADFALIDGNAIKYIEIPYECVIKGDSKSYSIAAASIIAKVTRDKIMEGYDKLYPEYGFVKHKGYPTKEHYAAIAEYGVLPIHRKSFRLY